ncbi:ficolin-2-like [Saccostrea cucullata]|uniref:ficolin-2-like n=1 Tax=Saccostrea cuccullata TaxID=36930 RepID=UPI002ED629F0
MSAKSDHEYFTPDDIPHPGYPNSDYGLSDSLYEKPVQVVHPLRNQAQKITRVQNTISQPPPVPKPPDRKQSKRSKRPLLVCCISFLFIITVSSVGTIVFLVLNNKDKPEPNQNTQISTDLNQDASSMTPGISETTTSKLTETITTPTTTISSIMTTPPMVETTIKTTQTTTEKTTTFTTGTMSPTTKETTTSMTTTPTTKLTTTTTASNISAGNRSMDCKQLHQQGYTSTGVYTIYPYFPVTRPVEVYCDMTTDGGGWTVFQHRKDGAVDFFWFWSNYSSGFGRPQGEHWLGNNHLHQLTTLGTSDLYILLEKFGGGWFYAKYKDFRIANVSDSYRMRVKEGSYQGTAGDSIESHGTTNTNGYKFTTIDIDNDFAPSNCALARKGAWWHNICTWANLNGIYGNGSCVAAENCNFWYSLSTSYIGVKTSFMMVRRV